MSCLVNYPWAVWGAGGCVVPDCASEMDQHKPTSSGYTRTTPAGNPSSGESNICTQCLIAGKTQTHIFSFCLPLLCVSPIRMHRVFFTVTSYELKPETAQVASNGGLGTNRACRHPSHTHLLFETNHRLWPRSFTSVLATLGNHPC